ncbi:MAG: DUF481 domain-containing protein [Ferruginibacter sp.]
MMAKQVLPVLFILFYLMVSFSSGGQIVNMENHRYVTDTVGWAGSVGGDVALSNYGQKVFSVNANAHVQFKSNKSLYLLMGEYGFLKGDDQSFVDFGFLHFRYNYKVNRILRWEAFTQLQQNVITKIEFRYLIGTGPRLKLLETQKLKLYFGSLPMFEIEKERDRPDQIQDWRISNYLSITWLPNTQTSISSTLYYQPVLFDIADYRLLNQLSCKIAASKKVAVAIKWNYQFDASPAAGVPLETYNFSTGVEIGL